MKNGQIIVVCHEGMLKRLLYAERLGSIFP